VTDYHKVVIEQHLGCGNAKKQHSLACYGTTRFCVVAARFAVGISHNVNIGSTHLTTTGLHDPRRNINSANNQSTSSSRSCTSIMATDITAPVPLQTLASKLDIASPEKSPVKGEHSSSPPPPIKDTSGILEDGEIDERQDLVGSLRSKPHLHAHSLCS
jgi:hypothetical protein